MQDADADDEGGEDQSRLNDDTASESSWWGSRNREPDHLLHHDDNDVDLLHDHDDHLHQVLQVKAVDGDRGIGNPITYSITGGADHLFAVNKLNGLVYVNVTFTFSSYYHPIMLGGPMKFMWSIPILQSA